MTRNVKLLFSTIAAAALFAMTGCGGGGSSDSNGSGGQNGANNSGFTTAATQTVTENNSEVTALQTKKLKSPVFTITGGADADKFEIDPQSGVLKFKEAPDFENPTDADHNNSYIVIVKAQDASGKTASETITVTVTNDATDDGPLFTSPDHATVTENRQLDFSVAANGAVSYKINGGADGAKVVVDPHSGILSFASFIPDYDHPSDADKNNIYQVVVQATDDQNHSSIQHLQIKIEDDPNDPVAQRHVWKTGQDDGVVAGLPFGDDRNFTEQTNGDDRVIVAGNRMWEDSSHSEDVTLGFYAAQDYCNGLNYGGYDDWRVPNRHELAEMINYGQKDILFDDIIEHKKGENYWTSQEKLSSGGNGSGLGWSISFSDGSVQDKDKSSLFYVRCIRGQEIQNHHDFSVDGDIVIDNKTGIMWQNAEFIGGRTWSEAKIHCKNLVFGGYNDWRLPNVNELRTIMPYDNNEILFEDLSPIGGGDLDSGHSWASTDIDQNNAYYNLNDWDEATNRDSLIIMFGEYKKDDDDDLMLNRCIRGGHL